MDFEITKDIVTTVAAAVGMGLGIYNYLRARRADRVRMRITPQASSYQGRDLLSGRDFYLHNKDRFDLNHSYAPPDTLSIEVLNLSGFPVTVSEVGLRSRWRKRRLILANPILPDGRPWPRKLESRDHVTVSFDLTQLIDSAHLAAVTHAYATTTCGATCRGTSGALREFVRLIGRATVS